MKMTYEILNSFDDSDEMLSEKIENINNSLGDYSITPLTPLSSDVTIITGGFTVVGKIVILNARFSVSSALKGVTTGLSNPGVPRPKVFSADKSYIAATVVDIQSDAPANCYGCISRYGNIAVQVPQADHEYAVSAVYICE